MERVAFDTLSSRVASAGEPFGTFFDPPDLRGRLARIGFRSIEDFGRDDLNARYFVDRADGLRLRGGLGRIVSVQV